MTLSSAEVLGAASEVLQNSGFEEVAELRLDAGNLLRCYEDEVSVVGVAEFETWELLQTTWVGAQTALVDLMSRGMPTGDPKAWEGYLVLLTLDSPSSASELETIRRDTTRLRKLVSTGSELASVADVDFAFLPILPLDLARPVEAAGHILERLPRLLVESGLEEALAQSVVAAFAEGRNPMEAIWDWRRRV